MPLVRVVPGQSVEALASFRDRNGATVVGNGDPAQWTIRDPDNNLVINGAGSQGRSDPSVWIARFTLPSAAPPTHNGERYQIHWELPLASGSISSIERFEVIAHNDPLMQQDETPDVLVVEGKRFVDSLRLPGRVVDDTLKYEIRDLGNNLIMEEESTGSTPDREVGDSVFYDFDSDGPLDSLVAGGGSTGLTPYMGVWEYQLPGEASSFEFHGLYVANIHAISLIQKTRAIVDRANLQDVHPFLTYTDLDLLHYIYRGFEYINSQTPFLSTWGPGNFPHQMTDLVVKAGAMYALQAQYLAEGMTTFDFQGLGVQLSIDRTQYIQTLVDQLSQELQDRVPRFKRLYIRSSSPGVLHISVHPLTNFVLNVDTSFFSRAELYRTLPFIVLGY